MIISRIEGGGGGMSSSLSLSWGAGGGRTGAYIPGGAVFGRCGGVLLGGGGLLGAGGRKSESFLCMSGSVVDSFLLSVSCCCVCAGGGGGISGTATEGGGISDISDIDVVTIGFGKGFSSFNTFTLTIPALLPSIRFETSALKSLHRWPRSFGEKMIGATKFGGGGD